MDPLRTRTSYCNASKVYLVITPSDKKILDEFNQYRTTMTNTDISDFDSIILKTFELKKDIFQHIEQSYFSVWRRIWLLHERWVAKELIYLYVSDSGQLEKVETNDLSTWLAEFSEKVIDEYSENPKLDQFCNDLLFVDESIFSQRDRKLPHLKFLQDI